MNHLVEPIKVLVIDDSAVTRRIISGFFDNQENVRIAGLASSGEEGLAEIENCEPDAVTLDLEMPGLSGTETLKEIRKRWPHLPVIILSAVSEHGARITLEALELGANDFITKPTFSGEKMALEKMGTTLVQKIIYYAQRSRNKFAGESNLNDSLGQHQNLDIPLGKLELVVIVQSEGKPTEVVSLLDKIPEDFPTPVVFAMQMPQAFSKNLVEKIKPLIDAAVIEAAAGMRLQAGTIYIAPGHMEAGVSRTSGGLCMSLEPAFSFDDSFKYIDTFLSSIATSAFGRVLVVVLEGAGTDGVDGLLEVVKSGGTILVQTEDSESIAGTAEAIQSSSVSHHQAPLAAIAGFLIRHGRA